MLKNDATLIEQVMNTKRKPPQDMNLELRITASAKLRGCVFVFIIYDL